MGKIEKVENSKMMEVEYEIRIDLPSARARRLESDERDLSPTVITTTRTYDHMIKENVWRKVASSSPSYSPGQAEQW